jgi:NTE family protein
VENSGIVADEIVRNMIRQPIGEPLNLERLETDMGTIYGTDYFARVNYEIEYEDDRNILLVRTTGRLTGTDYLRFGLNLEDDFRGGSQFNIGASFRVNGVNPLGAEWLTRVQLGQHQLVYTEFYQPLDYGSRYFVAPFLDAESRNIEVIVNNDPVVDYRQLRYGSGINVGRQISNSGEIRFGISRYWGDAKVRVGDPECVKRGYQGVICGHIHHAEVREVNGVTYHNCGDWVESCTALIEHWDGQIELYQWNDVEAAVTSMPIPAPPAEEVPMELVK